ncbi:hypothetical protein [Clostridium beijerinckii]|uniref:hypothetical protein n=1 Tax=Clostridium beijerinckii TaxID=1520 RepID=UPI0013613FF6|nr:hypothetical protein [Clostridium beijerinckii]MZK53358.1 hypothetical protein [Clostridium beijerinckii]MZK61463.1 hypothetical protein [Clostridium beijerinckii]MZK71705.1 hypothetical protein [Clostridium beijerinckii]MZK77098.1 hypothetical protein [Clostridium beijerinckii]MZK86753.1 hypothetical protein [Clostridium beijerinckii]
MVIEYKKNYSCELQEKINNIKLTDKQEETLKFLLPKMQQCEEPATPVFEDLYKLYCANVSTSDIAKIYSKNIRTIQLLLKKCGLARDRKKAQSIAVKKRDYVQIRETFKQTMLDRRINNEMYGSEIEQYVRQRLALMLNKEFKKLNGEAIIGVNTVTPVGELDIPIIILLDNKYYKYGVEVDGMGFHKTRSPKWSNVKDAEKEENLNKLDYKILRIETKAYMMKDEPKIRFENELKGKIKETVKTILNDFK